MKLVQKLRLKVLNNCIDPKKVDNSLEYWSNVLFARSIFALVPLSLLAVVPAIIVCLEEELYNILIFDLSAFISLIIIGFVPGISVKVRKIILISLFFMIAFVFLNELGVFGPGLVFLLASSVVMMIFFPTKRVKLPFILTLIFCILYGVCIHYKVFEIHESMNVPIMAWVAISSNVLFLSALFSNQIPFLFSRLESTIEEQSKLQISLIAANKELQASIDQIEKKNIELEQFAFVASHDLQEPLRTVVSFLGKINKDYKDQFDEKGLQYLNFASDGAIRMKQVILDLLFYSRTGNITEDAVDVDLDLLIQNYKLLRYSIISEKSVSIKADHLPVILSFKSPLTHVFHSILDNAIKYSQDGIDPIIQIVAEERDMEWYFSIEDNGIGIEAEYFDKIFIIFQRLHNQGDYGGTGIGLSVAKKQIESLGGKIWLESVPGKGSKFFFSLPKTKKQ
jgi:signal transduction histidine kinase